MDNNTRAADGSTKRMVTYGMMISLAFLLSYIETLIPIHLGVPGVKLGLANLVTILCLYIMGVKGAAMVSLVRIVLTGLTFGNLFSMIYSMAGGLLSLVLMAVCKKKDWFSQIGVSIVGGVGHNIGQLAVAAAVVENAGVFYYLPFLMGTGIAAGALVGLLGGIITKRISGYVKHL